jgi:PBP1b-binding outer membrane lipoprotein LpoB
MRKKLTLLACILLTISIFTGCSQQSKVKEEPKKQTMALASDSTNEQNSTNTNEQAFKNGKENLDLAVIKQDIGKDDAGNDAIICIVQSNRDYPLKNAIAEITFYNKDVKVLGTSTVKTDTIEAKDVWKFVVTIPAEYRKDFKAYRVSKLTGEK